MTPRRPSSASTDAGPSRMSFASAERLLYGPEMQQQHAYLLTEMRELQKQHEAYDARIQTTEAAAATAEAATSRIRHLEQQLAAIEAEDDDKAFEKWAAGEMTRLSIFVDTNKNVRQKQIELDKEVSILGEDLDRLRDIPVDLKGLMRRLEALEADRKEDAHRINSLEREVIGLKSMPQYSKDSIRPTAVPLRKERVNKAIAPRQRQDPEISDATTEDEDLVPLSKPIRELVQVTRSPETRGINPETILPSSPTGVQPIISARHRLLKRPSIHNTMLPRPMEEERQPQAPAPISDSRPLHNSRLPTTQLVDREKEYKSSRPEPESCSRPAPTSNAPAPLPPPPAPETEPHPHATSDLPPTQLVDREKQRRAPARGTGRRPRQTPNAPATVSKASPKKRKKPDEEPLTQRVTRSQVKKIQESTIAEQSKVPISGNTTSIEPTQLVDRSSSPRKKRKTTPFQQPMNTSSGPSRSAPMSPSRTREPNVKSPKPNETTSAETTQPVTGSPRKLKRPINPQSPRKKAAPRAARAPAGPTKKQLIVVLPYTQASQLVDDDDDKLLMDNGNGYLPMNAADRVKMSPRKATNRSPLKEPPKPKGYSKQHLQSNIVAGPTSYDENADTEDYSRSPSRLKSPSKPAISGRPSGATPSSSFVSPKKR